MKKKTFEETIQTMANSIARKHGFGKATTILFGNVKKGKIIDSVSCGYRKYTTGEYVCKAYLNHFGWKNTYYQKSLVTILLPFSIINWDLI
jgi:hypothetical protein